MNYQLLSRQSRALLAGFTGLRVLPFRSFSIAATKNKPLSCFSHMDYVGAIDQGTSSTRFLIFNTKTWKIVSSHQIEINQVFPHPGWVEIDPYEISTSVTKCIEVALKKLNEISGDNVASQLRAVGITNQRETTILWDKESGKPLYNAIVWLDNRTAKTAELLIKTIPGKDADYFKKITGLPIHPYFSALKIRWLLENVEAVRRAKDKGTLMFGNVDSWIVWNLTGKHVTDVTNASRTLLFDLEKAEWSSEMCDFFGIPMSILPEVHSSAENYGQIISSALKDVPVTGILGDQQASLVGHFCLKPGDIKNTYGTGTFMLCNVGTKPIFSNDGLLSTIAFQLGKNKQICYALEGSGSIGGNVIRFLRDNLNFYEKASDCEKLAKSVKDCGGVVFVPCFTGLFSPYWDASARGALFGVTQYTNKAHITRAALEAVCYQSADLLDAVSKSLPTDCRIKALKADGRMTENIFFNQLQSDIIGTNVITSKVLETTALGVSIAAAIGVGLAKIDDFVGNMENTVAYFPKTEDEIRLKKLQLWRDAISRVRNWNCQGFES